jgi:hypothetical protein
MRILKDSDNDLWEENESGLFDCRTQSGFRSNTLEYVERMYGPVTVYGQSSQKDTSVYRITYGSGDVKHGTRRVLAAVLGSRDLTWRTIEKVERAANIDWNDVSSEFLKDDE